MSKKKDVGKGIRALLSNIEKTNNPQEKVLQVKELTNNIALVPVGNIETNPFQPRVEFDAEELMDLAKSIKTFGLIQPVTLRSMGDSNFQLITGERRLRASKLAGLKEIPSYIRVANDQEMLEMELVENIQRTNLNPLEVAISYQRLIDECNLTHEEMSTRVGKNRSTITNYVRLLKLPPSIQDAIRNNKLSMGHARSLAGVENTAIQLKVFHSIINEGLSVRATEKLTKELQSSNLTKSFKKQENQALPAEVKMIKDRLSEMFGSKVDIKRNNRGQGQFVIKFQSDNEFNRIVDLLDEINE